MKQLDGKIAERMRAASRRQATTTVKPASRRVAHTLATARKLKSAGLDPTRKQSGATMVAIDAVPDAQAKRIRKVVQQDRMDGDKRLARAAVVSSLSDALNGLPDNAIAGLEAYKTASEAIMPEGSMDYAPRVTGGRGTYAEPDNAEAVAHLHALERAVGPKVTHVARWAVALGKGAVIRIDQADNAERAGLALYRAMEEMGG